MTLQFPRMPEQITKTESRILDYISNNPEEFLLSSIGEVGEKLDVSGTTISRFVRRLGCGDYKELRRLVALFLALSGSELGEQVGRLFVGAQLLQVADKHGEEPAEHRRCV